MVKSQKEEVVPPPHKRTIEWTPKMTMNMSDLSRDDDFLNHLLVEKLGTGSVPLYVHKMDPTRKLPKTDPKDLIAIVQRFIVAKVHPVKAIKQAVDELLKLHAVRTFIQSFPQPQIDAFATHASRYFELYLPSGSIEIAHTSRYTHRTGKSELCILATRYLPTGTVVTELKGSMAKLSREDEKEMKRNTDIRRDFSVIHSGQMKKNHLFLGPARFVNHDCENNCELFREGKYITFRTLRAIAIGEEITAHYGDGYFGRRNRHCLCATCERKGQGGYAVQQPGAEENPESESSDSSSDSDGSLSDDEGAGTKEATPHNTNERRTRRGVYHIAQRRGAEESDSDGENGNVEKESDAGSKPGDVTVPDRVVKIEEKDVLSELSSLSSFPDSRHQSATYASSSEAGPSRGVGMMTPDTDSSAPSPTQLLPPIFSATPLADDESSRTATVTPPTPKSIITTRRQKAVAAASSGKQQLITPPPSVETSSLPDESSASTSTKRLTRAEKGKAKATAIDVDAEDEAFTRVLRTRPSAIAIPVGTPQMTEIPRDENGKLLPTCLTCHSILPIIHVDREVVWGVGKKKEMKECPRCMRHFAIYGHPWPARTASQREMYMPTPREELTPIDSVSRRVSAKALSTLDKKIAAAAKNPGKSRLQECEASTDGPPTKKRKLEVGASASAKVKVSVKDKHSASANMTRSDRHSLPDTKSQEIPVKVKRPVGRPRKHPLPVPPPPPPPASSPSPSPPPREPIPPSTAPKIETISAPVPSIKTGLNRNMRPYFRPNKATVVQYQPRDGQGRFGKKPSTNGKFMRNKKFPKNSAKPAARRASDGAMVKLEQTEDPTLSLSDLRAVFSSGGEDEAEAPLRNINGRERKRRKDDTSESPQKNTPKRVRLVQDDQYESIPASFGTPLATVNFSPTPKPVINLLRPNPMNLSRPHWATQARRGLRGKPMDTVNWEDYDVGDLSSRRYPRLSRTEANHDAVEENSQRADNVDIEGREWRTIFPEELKLPAVGALTLRPSPGTFAKRRWSSGLWDSQPSSTNESEASDDEDRTDSDKDDESVDTDVDFKKRYSIYFTTPSVLNDHSDEEADVPIEDPERYALSRRASFTDEPARGSNSSDSARMVENMLFNPMG